MYKVVTKDFWGNVITKVVCQMEKDAIVWRNIFGGNHKVKQDGK